MFECLPRVPLKLGQTEPPITEPLAQAAFGAALATSILEQFDHGVLVLDARGRVLHANRVGLRECAQHGALRLSQGHLFALHQGDADRLSRALAAARQGKRTLLHFDGDERCLPLVVLPLNMPCSASAGRTGGTAGITLVLLAKRCGTEPLNVELFGHAFGLTMAEQTVLKGLSRGLDPAALAQANDVAVSTVRTQIVGIRRKTRTGSIRHLLDVINNLPPVVCAVECRA